MDKIEILVTEEYNNVRIDKALSNLTDELTRSYIQKLVEEGHIYINGELVSNKKNVVKTDDEIVVEIPPAKDTNIKAEDIEIDFVYEDDDIIIVNKKQGMVVHPAPGNWEGTLVNALMYHTEKLSSINGVRRPGIVHRIDKDTSGLLMIAKNDHAHSFLSEQLKEHTTTRKYYAIVHGNITFNLKQVELIRLEFIWHILIIKFLAINYMEEQKKK